MKRQTIALLATALMLMGCATQAGAGSLAGDSRFTRSGPNLGLSSKEVLAKNGAPVEKSEGGCAAPLIREGKEPVAIPGNAWLYTAQGNDAFAELSLCIIGDYVVAERSRYMNREGSRIHLGTTESIDADLVRRAVDDALGSSSKEERQLPRTGKEIEI